jgi:GntR family transcriptional regulator
MFTDTTIDRNSHTPFYIQVKNAIKANIVSGKWSKGHQLPGESELCRMFDVSRTVIRQALKELEYEGLIYRVKGKGTFVDEPKIEQSMAQELTGFYQDMVKRGLTPITKVLKQELTLANELVASRLEVEVGDRVIKLQRLRGVNDEFISYDTTYLPYDICPAVLHTDFTSRSLYGFLEDELGLTIARGYRTLEAVLADEYVARLLQIHKGAPLILLDSVVYLDDGRPIEYFRSYHRGGRARFAVNLIRIRQ